MRRRAPSHVLRPLAYGCAVTLVLLLGLEALARVLPLRPDFVLHPTQGNCLQRSALLGQEFRPNCRTMMTGKPLVTNELGMRDAPLDGDGRRRILAIGDSCTYGWAVDAREAYPNLLQGLLDAHGIGTRYRVINAGVPGYTSYHGVLYLRDRGLAFDPAIVIAGYGFNDIFRAGDVEEALRWQRIVLPALRLDDLLLDRSRLWQSLRSAMLHPPPNDLPYRSTAAQYKRNLEEIVRLAREHGAKPLLVSFWSPTAREQQHAAAVGEVSRELDVPVVVYRGPRLDVVHPTGEGYKQLASDIYDRLQEAAYLTP